ncbi:MAG: hypothetical protein DLM71_00755 [Chloroflexi bacterium]|nr:MAG: hypothetical protein DLM71_00755 [Chloroflexota bacterium]
MMNAKSRAATLMGWTIVGALLAATAALIAGIGLLRVPPGGPLPHSDADEGAPEDPDIGERPQERRLSDEPELEEPSPLRESGSAGDEPTDPSAR